MTIGRLVLPGDAVVLELPEVVAGELDTDLIARRFDDLAFAEADARVFAEAALLLDAFRDAGAATVSSPWTRRDGWRLSVFAIPLCRSGGIISPETISHS